MTIINGIGARLKVRIRWSRGVAVFVQQLMYWSYGGRHRLRKWTAAEAIGKRLHRGGSVQSDSDQKCVTSGRLTSLLWADCRSICGRAARATWRRRVTWPVHSQGRGGAATSTNGWGLAQAGPRWANSVKSRLHTFNSRSTAWALLVIPSQRPLWWISS
jgi:hypothetical protein